MKDQDTGIIPVVENGQNRRLVGVVTDRDLCMTVIAAGRDPRSVRVEECMTGKVVCCGPDDDVERAVESMREHQVGRRKATLRGAPRLLGA